MPAQEQFSILLVDDDLMVVRVLNHEKSEMVEATPEQIDELLSP